MKKDDARKILTAVPEKYVARVDDDALAIDCHDGTKTFVYMMNNSLFVSKSIGISYGDIARVRIKKDKLLIRTKDGKVTKLALSPRMPVINWE